MDLSKTLEDAIENASDVGKTWAWIVALGVAIGELAAADTEFAREMRKWVDSHAIELAQKDEVIRQQCVKIQNLEREIAEFMAKKIEEDASYSEE